MTPNDIDRLAQELAELDRDTDPSGLYERAERIIAESLSINYTTRIPFAHEIQATALRRQGKFEEARKRLDLALSEAQEQGDTESVVRALLDFGSIERHGGKLLQSKDYFDRAFELASASGNKGGMVIAQSQCADLLRHWGLTELAIDKMRDSWQLARGTDLEHLPLGGLAELIAIGGDLRTAIAMVQDVIEFRRRKGLKGLESFAQCWVAGLHAQLGEFQLAKQHYTEGLRLAEESRSVFRIAYALLAAGECELCSGEDASAEQRLQQALRVYMELGLHRAADCLVMLARIEIHRGNSDSAIAYLTDAINRFGISEIRHSLDEIHSLFVEAYELRGNWQKVAYHEKERRKAIEEINSSTVKTKLTGIQQLLATERERHNTEVQHLRAEHFQQQVAMQASAMSAQSELLERFRQQVVEVFGNMGEPIAALKKIREKLKDLPQQRIDWSKFDADFTLAHPEFRGKLQDMYPTLTTAELRLCIMLRLDLKSHEAAQLLALSERTVEKHRENIRKKLGIKREENIAEVLQHI